MKKDTHLACLFLGVVLGSGVTLLLFMKYIIGL